jgi:putative transcriptional regulator
MTNAGDAGGVGVLRSKRNATRYRILTQIAERQPAVSQREVADAIGVTSQAVSDYLKDLIDQGYVEKHGRGRYEVTNEGVDWLLTQTDELREFVGHVSEDVIEEIEVDTALATTAIEEGATVSLAMGDGVLRATAGDVGSATAIAVTDAAAGEDVGVTDFAGVLDYELGTVTVLSVPPVQDGGSATLDPDAVADRAANHDLVATAGTEALAAARAADVDPDIRFGTTTAVREAATKGLDVCLLAVADRLSAHTGELRDGNVSYEVVDTAT